MALVEGARDVLGQRLDGGLLGALGVVVVEARQHVLLVQALQRLALARHAGQEVRHLVRHVGPARRQQVHLDDGVAVVVEVVRLGRE